MIKNIIIRAACLCCASFILINDCVFAKPAGKITVFYAAGLNASMDGIVKAFRKQCPAVEVAGESSGTLLAIRKITELNKQADVLVVADAAPLKDMLVPGHTEWYINFYKDRIVLAYTDRSEYTDEINPDNWYEILARKGVSFGYASPDLAPIGYRTLMCWRLAGIYYKDKTLEKDIYKTLKDSCPAQNIMPDVAELLPLLESLSLDYAFIYESTAKQHNLKYIELPKEIDLGSMELADFYSQARVEVVSGKTGKKEMMTGSPITFAITILKGAPNYEGAVEFVKFFLGPESKKIMAANDQTVMDPFVAYNAESIPKEIKTLITGE